MLPNVVMYFAGSVMPAERVASFLDTTVGDYRLGPFEAMIAAFAIAYAPFGVRLIYAGVALPKFGEAQTFLNVRVAVAEARKTDWIMSACESCFENYQETVYFFLAAVLGCVQTGVSASLLADYATMWLLMRVLYILVTFAAMGKHVAIGFLRTPIFLTNIAVLTQMLMLAQDAYAAPAAKRGFF
jgi:uncharacterized MAPEG superfamily protein